MRDHTDRITLTPKGKRDMLDTTTIVGELEDHNHGTDTCEVYGCTPATYKYDHGTYGVFYVMNGPAGERWVRVDNPALSDGIRRAAGAADGKRQTVRTMV
jgi:hypothetical protein